MLAPMQKWLIVGCGYLGRRLAARLLAEGRTVTATTRSDRTAAELRNLGLSTVRLDVTDPSAGEPLPVPGAGVDVLVWAVGWDRSAGLPMRDVYVEGMQRVMAALPNPAPGSDPLRVVHVSSTSVYGPGGPDGRVDEDTPAEPTTGNGHVCLDAELALLTSAAMRGFRTVRLRFAGIYGPGRLPGVEAVRRAAVLPGPSTKRLNLIHVDDGVSAVIAAAANAPASSVFNVADGRPRTREEYYGRLAELLAAPAPQFGPPEGDRADRIITADRMRARLGISPRHADVLESMRACLQP